MAETIKFGDWRKIDLRVAKMLDVKPHPNADKLYLLDVDLGTEKRTLVAGLKDFYTAEELKGKNCVVFTNLEAKELRGIKSEGMILAAVERKEGKEVKVVLLQPEKDIELGSKVEWF